MDMYSVNRLAGEMIEEILESLGVKYKKLPKRIILNCPYCEDTGFNLSIYSPSTTGDPTSKPNCVCWRSQCTSTEGKKNLVALIGTLKGLNTLPEKIRFIESFKTTAKRPIQLPIQSVDPVPFSNFETAKKFIKVIGMVVLTQIPEDFATQTREGEPYVIYSPQLTPEQKWALLGSGCLAIVVRGDEQYFRSIEKMCGREFNLRHINIPNKAVAA